MNQPFYYVYILETAGAGNKHYVGFTENLRARLENHNAGLTPHTAKFRPWRLKTVVAFTDKMRALDFERHLKSASCRALAKKRL